MKHHHTLKLIVFLYFFFPEISFGQISNNSTQFNNDSLYHSAREFAFNGQRIKARTICRDILHHNSNYYDALVLIGRTYTWDSQLDSARLVLNEVLSKKPAYYDAIDGLIDVEFKSDHFEACIRQCDLGLTAYVNDKNFQLKKAKALIAIPQYDKATTLLKDVITQDPVNTEAHKLLNEIRVAQIKNKISLNYTYDYFEKNMIDPWQLAYLQYKKETTFGSIIGRINWANRFNTKGLQYELDAYPKTGKSSYLYLNLGYSDVAIFPHFRSGVEYNRKLPAAFETSFGLRYLAFSGSDVVIYTASLGKYIGNYWLSARTYITPGSIGTSVSGSITGRRYLDDQDNYLGLRISYGTSPDDRKELISSVSVLRVKSESIKIEYNKKINRVWILNLATIYENEEYYPSKFRYILTSDITISRLF
jgi:YaiO family outer membrane protein